MQLCHRADCGEIILTSECHRVLYSELRALYNSILTASGQIFKFGLCVLRFTVRSKTLLEFDSAVKFDSLTQR